VDWIDLADRDWWRAFLNTARFPQNVGKFLRNLHSLSFSRRTRPHGVSELSHTAHSGSLALFHTIFKRSVLMILSQVILDLPNAFKAEILFEHNSILCDMSRDITGYLKYKNESFTLSYRVEVLAGHKKATLQFPAQTVYV
jgi:hypothetical protein